MKIRINGDSIRFRLTRTEVETLCTQGYLQEKTHLNGNTFVYAVEKSSARGLSARFRENTITLFANEGWLEGWSENEKVGFEDTEKADGGTVLNLLLEKDFVCLDRRAEDQSDNYPNPKAAEHNKF